MGLAESRPGMGNWRPVSFSMARRIILDSDDQL